MSRTGEYLVAYDISDDKERNKVDKILSGYGLRVQKSVFEARLTKFQVKKLNLSFETLNLKTGFVKIYRLQSGQLAQSESTSYGEVPHNPENDVVWIV